MYQKLSKIVKAITKCSRIIRPWHKDDFYFAYILEVQCPSLFWYLIPGRLKNVTSLMAPQTFWVIYLGKIPEYKIPGTLVMLLFLLVVEIHSHDLKSKVDKVIYHPFFGFIYYLHFCQNQKKKN